VNRYPFHILLFSIFPVVHLYSLNAVETNLYELLPASAALLCCAIILWLLLKFALGNGKKAGLIVSLSVLYFFSYGPVLAFIDSAGLWPFLVKMHFRITLAWLLFYLLMLVIILLYRGGIERLTRIANYTAIFLVASSVAFAAYSSLSHGIPVSDNRTSRGTIRGSVNLPDVYYIIVDGYGRADILQEFYGIDNSNFVSCLRQRGFYVADSSRSNYIQTLLSLASSLNMSYLDDLTGSSPDARPTDKAPLKDLINNSEVMNFLGDNGYTTIAFSSGISSTEMRTADLLISGMWVLTEFEQVLIALTPLTRISEKLGMQYAAHRNRLRFTFDNLPKTPRMNGPVFIFAHVIAPHPPFVFDSDGAEVNPDRPFIFADGSHFTRSGGTKDEYRKGYAEYVSWLNGRLIESIDSILARSMIPPVIVLHADHGPGSMLDWGSVDKSNVLERTSILNAVYTGGLKCSNLYPTISPVNIFRAVFNCAFGTDLELLADRSFYSAWTTPYQTIDITNELDERRKLDSLESQDVFMQRELARQQP